MKTVEELKLPSQKYLDALIAARDFLSEDKTTKFSMLDVSSDISIHPVSYHHSEFRAEFRGIPNKDVKFFNMSFWADYVFRKDEDGEPTQICGTVRCIAGWAEALGNVKFSFDMRSNGLDALFHPNVPSWEAITQEHAVKAIDQYLETGAVDWNLIVDVPPAIV